VTANSIVVTVAAGSRGSLGIEAPRRRHAVAIDSHNEVSTRSTRAWSFEPQIQKLAERTTKEEEKAMKIRRYVTVRRLGVVAVVAAAVVATAAPLGVMATSVPEPEPTASSAPVAMSIDETQAVMDAYVAALVGREDIAPYFSEDVVFELVDVGQRLEGRDEVVAAIVELHEQTFDAIPEVKNAVIGEGTAALEVVFVGTHTGEFAGIPATGMDVAVPYSVFYDLADGKITALRIYGFATGLVAALTAEAGPASTAP